MKNTNPRHLTVAGIFISGPGILTIAYGQPGRREPEFIRAGLAAVRAGDEEPAVSYAGGAGHPGKASKRALRRPDTRAI